MGIASMFILSLALAVYVEAQTRTITVDNTNRREYTYCPIPDSTARSLNAEIDGCPLMRVYINNWSSLTVLQQNTIDTQMRTLGFVDAGEHLIK
jgi:hypothetical protein